MFKTIRNFCVFTWFPVGSSPPFAKKSLHDIPGKLPSAITFVLTSHMFLLGYFEKYIEFIRAVLVRTRRIIFTTTSSALIAGFIHKGHTTHSW